MIRLPVLQSTLQCCKYSRSSLFRCHGNHHISTASKPVETAAAAHHRNSLRGSSSRHIRTMIMASNKPASGAGQAMFALNQWTQGKREPWVKMVKGCVDLVGTGPTMAGRCIISRSYRCCTAPYTLRWLISLGRHKVQEP